MAVDPNQQMNLFEDPVFYAYFGYSVLFLISFLSQLILFIQIRVHRLSDNLSTNLLINIGFWIAATFVSLFRSYFVLYVGTAMNALNLALSVSVTFMTLDRILALLMPLRYDRHRSSWLCCTLFCCFIAFFLHISTIIAVDQPRSEYTSCKLTLCLLTPGQIIITHGFRVFISFLNLITSGVFNLALYKHWHRVEVGTTTRESYRRTNFIVVIAGFTELICNSGPHIFSLALTITGGSSTSFGPFVTVFGSFDALVTALIYRYLIIKRVNTTTSTVELVHSNRSDSTNSRLVRVK